jgi:type II secretory pathway pseudopilin PulG
MLRETKQNLLQRSVAKPEGFARHPFGGFTIIELLTVLSIIIILLAILVPALSKVRIYAKNVTQRGQFYEIAKGIELYRNDHRDTLPDSGPADTDPVGPFGYCGAMKLCEALLGQDGMGYNTSSRFLASGIVPDVTGTPVDLYPFDLCTSTDPADYDNPADPAEKLLIDNLRERIKYVDVENIKGSRLQDLYKWDISARGTSFRNPPVTFVAPPSNTRPYSFPNAVISDVYLRITTTCSPRLVGMPVLYYKADPSKLANDVNTIPNPGLPNINIYDFDDNYAITALGCPWETVYTTEHPMFLDPRLFYKEIRNTKITTTPRPHNEDGYILMSAGYDGLYGTRDDVFNFAD